MRISDKSWAGSARKAAISLAFASGLVAGSSPSQAGLLDFLFGPAPPPPVAAPAPRGVWPSPSPEEPVTERPRQLTGQKPINTSLCCKNGENPRSAIMADPTLRPGDAVMTASGITIFQGEPGVSPHAPSDFTALAQAQAISPESRARLQALDRAQRGVTPAPATH